MVVHLGDSYHFGYSDCRTGRRLRSHTSEPRSPPHDPCDSGSSARIHDLP